MQKKTLTTVLFVAIFLGLCQPLYSWEKTYTHPALSKEAVGLSQVDNYLKNELGISEGVNKQLQLYTYSFPIEDIWLMADLFQRGLDYDIDTRTILDWIKTGSILEDAKLRQARSRHHFYDPTCNFQDFNEPGRSAGLDNITDHPNYSSLIALLTYIFGTEFDVTGESALHWAIEGTSTKQPTTNYQTWESTRQYFYEALTEETPDLREHYLALTLLSVGHLLHLIEDMGVPAHTRNDFLFAHTQYQPPLGLGNPLEGWVEEQVIDNNKVSPWSGSGPIVFDKLTKYFDANVYDSNYLGDGIWPPTNLWGLAECTNYQFLSLSTVFGCYGVKYQFPHPARENTEPNLFLPVPEGEKVYFNGSNYGVTHLARDSYTRYVSNGYTPSYPVIDSTITTDDVNVFIDYANITLPRTINYATGLMNYFFRGRLGAEQLASCCTDAAISITNDSHNSGVGQTLKGGIFELYWDDPNGNRTEIADTNFTVYEPAPSSNQWNSTSTLAYNQSTEAIFTLPEADVEKYILVYKGNICQDANDPDLDDQSAIATTTFDALGCESIPDYMCATWSDSADSNTSCAALTKDPNSCCWTGTLMGGEKSQQSVVLACHAGGWQGWYGSSSCDYSNETVSGKTWSKSLDCDGGTIQLTDDSTEAWEKIEFTPTDDPENCCEEGECGDPQCDYAPADCECYPADKTPLYYTVYIEDLNEDLDGYHKFTYSGGDYPCGWGAYAGPGGPPPQNQEYRLNLLLIDPHNPGVTRFYILKYDPGENMWLPYLSCQSEPTCQCVSGCDLGTATAMWHPCWD